MPRQPSNQLWSSGRPAQIRARGPTGFDEEVRRLGLDEQTSSRELKKWCELNKNRCYIPESLLKHWGMSVDPDTADHTTISRTHRLLDVETHREVFGLVLGVLADRRLVKGKRIAIDATTLEGNAGRGSLVGRGTGGSWEEFLRGLAKASGIETPSRKDLARLDRKRKKRTSNKEWESPVDGDARIAKMKDGR